MKNPENRGLRVLRAAALALAAAFAAPLLAQPASQPAVQPAVQTAATDKSARKDLVLRGDAKCTRCHDASDDTPVLAIGKTRHGTMADGRTPSCTSCHGESETHVNKPEGVTERPRPEPHVRQAFEDAADRAQRRLPRLPPEGREALALDGQHAPERATWPARPATRCTPAHDKVRDKRTQPEVCFACHKEQRAQINKPSHHPIPEGKMGCSDCHNAHGSVGPKLMKRDSVNDTCYTCHMEKRGPFVHPHEPVERGLLELPQPAWHGGREHAQGAPAVPVPPVPHAARRQGRADPRPGPARHDPQQHQQRQERHQLHPGPAAA